MVFELMEGGDLLKFYRERYEDGMPIEMVISFTEQLLKAVAHIHSSGYIHRDIKASNIVLGDRGSRLRSDGHMSSYDR